MAQTFKGLKFKPHKLFFGPCEGVQVKAFYPNGYGVSVIKGRGSYGYPDLYEMAVLKGNKKDWDLCYDTHITNGVLGYLTPRAVTKHMRQVQAL